MSAGMKITSAGLNLLAKALEGKELNFTRAAIGDGVLENQEIISMTDLIHSVRDLPITGINKSPQIGTAEVVCEMTNTGLERGFWCREYGLFARDPDTLEEILYSYRNIGDEASYMPGSGGADVVNYTLSLVTVIDQAENVTAYITSNNNYVTSAKLESKVQALFGNFETIKGFWTYANGDTQKLRPASIDDARALLIGSANLANLASRITTLEDVIAQVLLAIETKDLYPDYSQIIPEDFINPDKIDVTKCKVTSVVAGDDSLDCDPLNGLQLGSFYLLSDGISYELLQIRSVTIENGIQRVIMTTPVQNNYKLESAYLYRQSAIIENGRSVGISGNQFMSWKPNEEWSGSSAMVDYSISLNTSLGNSSSYEVTGTGEFTSTGYATLKAS